MLAKLLIGTGLLFIGKHVHSLLELTDHEKKMEQLHNAIQFSFNNVGKVVKSKNGTKLYLLWNRGSRVEYVSQQAYINHGSKEIMVISDELLNSIPIITNAKIFEDGFKWDKE